MHISPLLLEGFFLMTVTKSLAIQEVHTYTVLIINITNFINPQAFFLVKFLFLKLQKTVIEKRKHCFFFFFFTEKKSRKKNIFSNKHETILKNIA